MLRTVAGYFLTRRYVYEMLPPPGAGFSTEVSSLNQVIRSLHDTARELDPELRVDGDPTQIQPFLVG